MKPNIGPGGRLLRAGLGLVCLIGAAFLFTESRWLGVALLLAGLFCLFEALRGWCALRACGMKTPL